MKRLLLCVVVLLAGSLLSGCDEVIQEVLFDMQSLAESTDPRVKIAGSSAEAAQTEKQAREHYEKARETLAPAEIARAVELRPVDIRYRAYQVALLTAYPGLQDERQHSLEAIIAILDSASETGKSGEPERAYFYSFYLPALIDLSQQFPQDTTEGGDIRSQICLARYRLHEMSIPVAKQILDANPYNGPCDALGG